MQTSSAVAALALVLTQALANVAIAADMPADAPAAVLERGRYVALTMGCNECHTAGYAQAAGVMPESQWLTGSPLGHAGGWGTTYAPNLRIYMQNLSADEWVAKARAMSTRPPMPWFAIRKMTDGDLRALHALIRSLGPVGEAAPTYLPPGQAARGPVVRYP